MKSKEFKKQTDSERYCDIGEPDCDEKENSDEGDYMADLRRKYGDNW